MVSVLPEVKLPALHVMHDVAPFSLYNLTSPHAAHFSSAPAENFPALQRSKKGEGRREKEEVRGRRKKHTCVASSEQVLNKYSCTTNSTLLPR